MIPTSLLGHGTRHAMGGYSSTRVVVLGLGKILFLLLGSLPFLHAAPLHTSSVSILDEVEPKEPDDPSLWVYLSTAIVLVLLGGVFAGLTIALMGQDEVYLQVIAASGEGNERKNSARVLRLLKRGKHWVLVTLLLSNVITNETLPIVLDRSLGGGWPAVVASTVLIVIFGEVVPQSICVRFGLPIGAWCAPMVTVLMWIMSPVAYPTAMLLDKVLGKDHGTMYKKAGLKTLMTLHRTLGTSPDERLNQDEVTIISAVLDLKDKSVGTIMTPMNDVFTLSADTVLNEDMMDTILSAGYSRIPIYAPDNQRNFVGMLLVKMLITYDPEDCLKVRDFALATLPETRPETSCLDIVNFFQEGKSHMVLVSDFPGESFGALGVVTLEDVIEELIGEEIIDESDVFIDVHKAIRRMAPAPRSRVPKGEVVNNDLENVKRALEVPESRDASTDRDPRQSRKGSTVEYGQSPKTTTFLMRRKSSGTDAPNGHATTLRTSDQNQIREHLKHLGPSNAASKPKTTRFSAVKIKPGVGTIPENHSAPQRPTTVHADTAPQGGFGEGLLAGGGRDASDGVIALAQGYGTLTRSPTQSRDADNSKPDSASDNDNTPRPKYKYGLSENAFDSTDKLVIDSKTPELRKSDSHSTIGSLHSNVSQEEPKRRNTARSGSITENFIDHGGVKKMILETTSSSNSDDGDNHDDNQAGPSKDSKHDQKDGASASETTTKSKKKRKKRVNKKKKGGDSGNGNDDDSERAPLLHK
ncbi:DUF21-domain-containing protein [Pseudovirgaria hyperparasitica]|uniref:DUF21-domain-containing protein n=1 Tax=Pseudovirgaria hyperparasitica TaxID=470096 RepID=A0A6A6WEX0_9PEZI|nr:DUF21-domain-containing protein [Pseudovirgaria hyperparasitica]KAF2760436.1 DUF21-domain-containing protein [Pseudovirgaria hyperparasitica]